jgi:hypothetical protein
MQNSEYSPYSIFNTSDVLENFQSGDRLLPYAHTYADNASGQTQDRPDRILYMQWDNDGITAGHQYIGLLLEGLSNIPGNYDDGNFIVDMLEQNLLGFSFNSEIDYGLLFDFDYTGGGLTIEFSPYALDHIIGDLEHADGIYGTWGSDLFISPHKIDLLEWLSLGGWVSFEDVITYGINFANSDTNCISEKMRQHNGGNNTYNRMYSSFNGSLNDILNFNIENVPGNNANDNWGKTFGDIDNNNPLELDFYKIVIDNDIEGSSNLAKEITLIHELIHAYLFDALHEAGVLNFTADGGVILNATCFNVDYSGVDFTTVPTAEQFNILICAMNQSGLLNGQNWSHEIFNNFTFSTSTYQEAIEEFIFQFHEWDQESSALTAFLQNTFGNIEWRTKTAEFISWRGLEQTIEFQQYAIANSYVDANGDLNAFYNGILNAIRTIGISTCD